MTVLPPKYDDVNKIVNKHILSFLTAILVVLIPILLYAGGTWVESQIEDKMGNYATKAEIVIIQKQISSIQIDNIQEKIYEIKDKKIDGLTSNSDEKKLIRLENKIQVLRIEKNNF